MARSVWFKRMFFLPVAMVAMLVVAFSVSAAPTIGPFDDSFYTVPTPLPSGSHGDLIRYRRADSIIPGAPGFDAWNVLYLSTDGVGNRNAVTGTVFMPDNYNGRVMTYAIGTHGLASMCAPSKQYDMGIDYENANIVAALNAGYALVVTDNPGFTNGDIPSYMVGIAQGHASLDIITAAKQIPLTGINDNAKVAIWGYSQGGQTACWAGQLQPSYLPNINLVGVAAGGVPGDLIATGHYIDGKVGSSFLLQVVMGFWSQYPDQVPLWDLANDEGKEAMERAQEVCTFGALFEFMHVELSEFVTGNPSLDELIDTYVYGPLMDQKLGNMDIEAPLYMYHGTMDEIIPLEQSLELKEAYCDMGMNVTYGVYPGEHIITQFQAATTVLDWLNDRFNGESDRGTCFTLNRRPVANNNPLEGDFIVSMNNWPLKASMHLARLDQDVFMPEDSTYSVDSNMNTNQVVGEMNIPDFKAPIKVLVNLNVGLKVEPTEPMTGNVSLDDEGGLHIHGHQYVIVSVDGVGLTRLAAIPIRLETEEPVDFAVDFDGPISVLGSGDLTFTGETTFPPMTGGMFKTLFTALMSGPGQTYSFNVSPPAPTKW